MMLLRKKLFFAKLVLVGASLLLAWTYYKHYLHKNKLLLDRTAPILHSLTNSYTEAHEAKALLQDPKEIHEAKVLQQGSSEAHEANILQQDPKEIYEANVLQLNPKDIYEAKVLQQESTKAPQRVRVCSSAERLAHVRKYCPTNMTLLYEWLHSFNLTQLRSMTKYWLTDETHHVLACLHAKVSTATWDVILCNNSMAQPLPANHTMRWNEWKACLSQHNIYHLGEGRFNKKAIIKRIKSYYKFMVVRHPLDRILSVFLDKLRDGNSLYPKIMGSVILQRYRKHLPEKAKRAGKGVYFQEFVQYIIDGARNTHWSGPYSNQCQPYHIDYDAIVKLETFSSDVPPIIQQLAGRMGNSKTNQNSYSTSHWDDQYVKNLDQYRNITDTQLLKLVQKYSLDFAQFGYDYARHNSSLDISCHMNSTAGDICC